MAFFGDGATNIGAFHEALNFAAVYQLPSIFVCENNLYMEYTAIGEVTVRHPADRAAAYGWSRRWSTATTPTPSTSPPGGHRTPGRAAARR